MHLRSSRIAPLSPDEFTAEQKALVGEWSYLNFSRVIVQHEDLYRTFLPFLDKVIRGSHLPPRDREVLVIRALAICDEDYEAEHHVSIARNAGMTEAEISAVKTADKSLS